MEATMRTANNGNAPGSNAARNLSRDIIRNPARNLSRNAAAAIAWLLLLLIFPAINRAAESAEAGKQLFEKRCTGCHSLEKNKVGPRLGDVYGRQAGTAPGFQYSAALKSARFAWDEAKLDHWLTDTESVVEDNNMDFHVAKAEERAEIIGFLKSLSAPRQNTAQQSASNATSPAR